MSKIKNLKKEVLFCLEKYPETRNSDIKLTNAIWIEFYAYRIRKVDGEWVVRLIDLYELPTEDNVKRVRAVVQNEEHKYLPTSEEVRRKRKIKEEEWRRYLGYNPELITI